MRKQITIDGSVGKLAAIIQKPALKDDEKCGMVIIMHGLMRDKNFPMLEIIADRLELLGIASIRFDFNGRGESEGNFEDTTINKDIEDALKVYDYISGLNYVKTISLLGHSQGGLVASIIAGRLSADKIRCMVLMAPAGNLKDQAKAGTTLGAKFDPENLPDFIEVNGHKIGKEFLKEAQEVSIYGTAEQYYGPVCIIQGKVDTVVPPIYGQRFQEIFRDSVLHLHNNENHTVSYNIDLPVHIAVEFLQDEIYFI